MSIKAVDTQIMVSRLPDVAKDASLQAKNAEKIAHESLFQSQMEAKKDSQTVAKSEELSASVLRLDHRETASEENSDSNKDDESASENANPMLEIDVGLTEPHIIDIKL